MAEPGALRMPPLRGWQRSHVIAAANYLRAQIVRTPDDPKLRTAYDGLLDLLDPSRLLARRHREQADAARAAVSARRAERRSQARRTTERRKPDLSAQPQGVERRKKGRRSGHERRR